MRPFSIGLLTVAAAIAASAALVWSAETPKTLSPQDQQRATALAKTALGADGPAAVKAIQDLKAMGEAAKPRLINAVRDRLVRDRDAVMAAVRRIGDVAQAKAMEEEMTALRKAAKANIEKLAHDETLRIAHENYDKLAKMNALFKELCVAREAICSAMARRGELMAIWQEVALPNENRMSPAAEEKLKAAAEGALGMTVEVMRGVPEFEGGKEPSDPAQWNLWFLRACRRIEAYNLKQTAVTDAGELENITLLNAYRESLGTLPVEIDARLEQSARRHSKEMGDLGYFAHESPTASEKTHAQRMKNAGYTGGYSENIASGTSTGKGAFWMWFDSPGHHKNMVHAGSTAIGVGRWGGIWTQNFGTAQRLMLADDAERAKAVVLGTVLPPQK
ncbi:MAG: CAP domain-containing protein [Planctomycetota bacterium]|nr:CAP domain-containing protein [Planctomycetota bacterium]